MTLPFSRVLRQLQPQRTPVRLLLHRRHRFSTFNNSNPPPTPPPPPFDSAIKNLARTLSGSQKELSVSEETLSNMVRALSATNKPSNEPEPPAVSEPILKRDQIRIGSTLRNVERMELVHQEDDVEFATHQALSYGTFKHMAPYIAMHRGQVVVVHVPGEVTMGLDEPLGDSEFVDEDASDGRAKDSSSDEIASKELALSTMRDILLLKTLGVKPVLVAGCRPQIRRRLKEEGIKSFFAHGNRVCDKETLAICQSVAGHVRVQIESTLSRGLTNTPTDMGTASVVSGNFVKAIPFGVRNGIDFKFTGVVQKLTNVERMQRLLDEGHVLLLSHLGYSPSGDIFNCRSEDVAVVAATQLKASKLVFLHNGDMVVDDKRRGGVRGRIVHNLHLSTAIAFEAKLKGSLNKIDRVHHSDMDPSSNFWRLQFLDYVQSAIEACKGGVRRVHLVSRHIEGAIVSELYTREGAGMMVSRDVYEGVRPAKPEDVQSILALIRPLEAQGILVTRPPEQVEAEITKFIVFERDGEVLGCCQLVHYEDDRYEGGAAEMCCVAVAESQRGTSLGSALLSYCMRSCVTELQCHQLFVLSTRTASWFTDRGFVEATPEQLPPKKRATYSYKRKPKIYFRAVHSERAADEYDLQFH